VFVSLRLRVIDEGPINGQVCFGLGAYPRTNPRLRLRHPGSHIRLEHRRGIRVGGLQRPTTPQLTSYNSDLKRPSDSARIAVERYQHLDGIGRFQLHGFCHERFPRHGPCTSR
jgi:hypothetical protein